MLRTEHAYTLANLGLVAGAISTHRNIVLLKFLESIQVDVFLVWLDLCEIDFT